MRGSSFLPSREGKRRPPSPRETKGLVGRTTSRLTEQRPTCAQGQMSMWSRWNRHLATTVQPRVVHLAMLLGHGLCWGRPSEAWGGRGGGTGGQQHTQHLG